MSSVVHSVLGAALLLTGASAAMAQTANPPVANQPAPAAASTAVVASNNAPVANQTVQTGASAAIAAPTAAAPIAAQPQKPASRDISDRADLYNGHGPNSLSGTRAFWENLNGY